MRSSNYINKFYIKTQTIFKNNIYTKITANRKWYPCQQCFTPLYKNTTTVHNYNEQLHPKVRIFKDNSCYFVVDIVLPFLNCLCMFICVYNSVYALGTHYEDRVCGVVLYYVQFPPFFTHNS